MSNYAFLELISFAVADDSEKKNSSVIRLIQLLSYCSVFKFPVFIFIWVCMSQWWLVPFIGASEKTATPRMISLTCHLIPFVCIVLHWNITYLVLLVEVKTCTIKLNRYFFELKWCKQKKSNDTSNASFWDSGCNSLFPIAAVKMAKFV